MPLTKRQLSLTGLSAVLILGAACVKKPTTATNAPPPPPPVARAAPAPAAVMPGALAPTCDDSLWQHVYVGDPRKFHSAKDRLKVITPCMRVTGTIFNAVAEKDGDFHIRVTVDSQFTGLLNAKNTSGQGGHLVVEPVCENAVMQKDTLKEGVCNGFSQNLYNASLKGKHVEIVGVYIEDMEHGWREIHPVTSIKIIP